MEPLDLYKSIQPLVIQDARKVADDILSEDKYSPSNTQAHTHNGTDSVQFPFANLADSDSYLAINTITLTPAQVKLLNTTPITIVPKPLRASLASNVAGTVYKAVTIVTNIVARLNYAGTAYTGANNLEFRYTNGSGAKVTADISTTFLNSAASAYSAVAGVTTELVPVANAPIVVTVPVADPGAGTSPITFTIHYRIVAFRT